MSIKKILIGTAAGALMLGAMIAPAFAAKLTVGNDANSRSVTDTYSNFVIVDTNHPANANGYLTEFKYYAANSKPFTFLLVDTSNKVQWESDSITPGSTGLNTYTPKHGVKVMKGWNLGVYFSSTGTIPFEYNGSASPAEWTANGSGLPEVKTVLTLETGFDASATNRVYSFVATGGFPKNEDQCRGDGWRNFDFPTFWNEDQCTGFVHNRKGIALGDLFMSGPSQQIRFLVFDSGNSSHDRGSVEYWNYDYPNLHYTANATCVSVYPKTKEARFMFQIPSGWSGLTGLYVVAYVKSGSPNLYGHNATSSLTQAKQWCNSANWIPPMYPVTSGKLYIH